FEMCHDVRMGQHPVIQEGIFFRCPSALDRSSGTIHDLKMPQLQQRRNGGRRSEVPGPPELSLEKKVIAGDQMLEAGVRTQRQGVFCDGYERCIWRVVACESHGQRARHPARPTPSTLAPCSAESI